MAVMTGNAIREALGPLIRLHDEVFRDGRREDYEDDRAVWGFNSVEITYGDLRRARTAYDAIRSGVKANWIANCVRCGRVVDTREVKDGGDKFGCELARGGWTCSFECWEAEVDAADNGAGPYGGAKADEEAVAFEFDRYINGTLMAEGVKIECQPTLEKAFKRAAQIALRGANGEVPVLVLRSPLYPRPADEPGAVERITRERDEARGQRDALQKAWDDERMEKRELRQRLEKVEAALRAAIRGDLYWPRTIRAALTGDA